MAPEREEGSREASRRIDIHHASALRFSRVRFRERSLLASVRVSSVDARSSSPRLLVSSRRIYRILAIPPFLLPLATSCSPALLPHYNCGVVARSHIISTALLIRIRVKSPPIDNHNRSLRRVASKAVLRAIFCVCLAWHHRRRLAAAPILRRSRRWLKTQARFGLVRAHP